MPIINITDQLRRDEGKKYSAYSDSEGFITIGVGTCIDSRKGCALTDDEVDLLLDNRVALAGAKLSEQFPWTDALDDVRRGALVNMCYQMGVGGLAEFHQALAAIQQGDWETAAAAMLDSKWAKVQSPARAQRLAQQIITGVWQ